MLYTTINIIAAGQPITKRSPPTTEPRTTTGTACREVRGRGRERERERERE